MLPISIKFQAYIPNSLGKPLLSYFQRYDTLSLLSNKEEFVRKLQAKDRKGFTWLPEPGGNLTSCFFATDNVDMHNHSSEHTTRLGLQAEINPKKIGSYNLSDNFFSHKLHKNWGGINGQHSDESQRVRAYIKRIPFYDDMPRPSSKDIYVGICDSNIRQKRSFEAPLKASVTNSKRNSNSAGAKDTTTIKVSGSANYPFLSLIAPNIDFELEIKLYRNSKGKSVIVNVKGWHNYFPAFELVFWDKVVYKYNPSAYGYSGPTFSDLTKSKNFSFTEFVKYL
ncbi:hypothetical protein ABIB40_000408 [Pedobacter sp. UYP30]|uniref:hypothetical protein n=1 Tax=Pedobacter sp. UYP30 TaxID=1756400 RepID=UPI0033930BBE